MKNWITKTSCHQVRNSHKIHTIFGSRKEKACNHRLVFGIGLAFCLNNLSRLLSTRAISSPDKKGVCLFFSSPGSHTVLCFFYSFYNSLMAKPNPPTLTDPTEISVTASWTKTEAATAYQILVKSIADEEEIPWTKHNFDSNTLTAEIDGLEPTNTYIFRIIAVLPEGDSEMSEEAVIDTLVAGCGGANGEKKKSCCQVQ